MLSEEQKRMLNDDLPATATRERKGGGSKTYTYVEGWWVKDELNRILGPGGWSYDCDATEAVRVEKENDKKEMRWHVSHTAKCVLVVGDCEIGDYGVGHGVDRDLGAAIESSIKEAATDALKRCAVALGRRLGLALYDKERQHVSTGDVPGPTETGQRLIDEARACAVGDRAAHWKKCRGSWADLNAFDRDTLNALAQSWAAEKSARGAS